MASCFGHIRDLVKKNFGIDKENNYKPQYEVSAAKRKVVTELKKLAKNSGTIWLATDEDREGEAIAWHLAEVLTLNPGITRRIMFAEITKDAILYAVANPRQIDQAGAERLRESYRKFGQVIPFAISPANLIYDGHQRDKVWSLMEEIDPETDFHVMVSNRDLTYDEQRFLGVYLVQASGSWDYDGLGNIFEAQELLDLGFSKEELHLDLDPPEEPEEPEEPEVNAVHELLAKWGVETGDIWMMGDHMVICGDCMDPVVAQEIKQTHRDSKVKVAVVTDPPYGLDLDTDYSKMGKTKTKYEKIIGDEHPWDPIAFMELYLAESYWLWGADYYLDQLMSLPDDGSLIVWAKAQSQDEDQVFGSSFEILWTYPPRKRSIWFIRRIGVNIERLGVHPTQKPLETMLRPVELSKAELIWDPYLGTGTTLIACERVGIPCAGVEISPGYVAVILERWAEETGLSPSKVDPPEG